MPNLVETLFVPAVVDPSTGRQLVVYTDLAGDPIQVEPPSGRIMWVADDGGTVVSLGFGAGWLEIEPVSVGTAELTCSGSENGSTATQTVLVSVSMVGGRLEAAFDAEGISLFSLVDGGTVGGSETYDFDAGPPGMIETMVVDSGTY